MHIHTKHKKLKSTLDALVSVLRENGAQFHRDLILSEHKNDLSIHMETDAIDGDMIVTIPFDLMLPSNALGLKFRQDTFDLDPDAGVLSESQLTIAYLMVEAYNHMNKAKRHTRRYPWIIYQKSPDVLEPLLDARPHVGDFKTRVDFFYGAKDAMTFDEFVCWSFLKSRVLEQKNKTDDTTQDYLMPFTDFFNHHPMGSTYIVTAKDETPPNSLCIQKQQTSLHSNECFTRYGNFDAVDAFLRYGFMAENIPFVSPIKENSDPLEFYKNAYMRIDRASGSKKLKKQLKDLMLSQIQKCHAMAA